jgi:hypothetical protein
MSFRADYTGALNTKLAEARTAGYTFIKTTKATEITAALVAAAASGKTTFTYTATVTYQPADIKLGLDLWSAHKSGMEQAFAENDIMLNEYTIELNLTDATITQVDIDFTF